MHGIGSDWTFILPTSGSTGSPKRVVMTDKAMLAMGEADRAELGLTPRSVIGIDRWGSGALRKIYDARVSGAMLSVYPGREKRSMREWIGETKLTHLSTLATTVRWLASGIYKFPTVEVLELGGEPGITWADVAIARNVFPNAAVVNRYATSETHVVCRFWPGAGIKEGILPVGLPVRGVEVWIDDGEIIVRSPFLADGYYNDPIRTQAKFGEDQYGRFYRTGDSGYFDDQGALIVLGRKDFGLPVADH